MRRFALLLALLLAACGDDEQHGGIMPTPTPTPPAVRGILTVEGDTLVFRTDDAAVRVGQSPLRLTLTDSSGRVVASQVPSGLSFLAGGGAVASGDVSTYALTENDGGAGRTRTLELSVTTATGDAHVRLDWLSDRTLRVAFAAPDGIAPSHYADAWTLAPGEAIYGLTERLTDSRPLTNVPGFPPIDEIAPRAVGSLDRRGEAIRMLVQATMAVYAPFHTSSNGYGLFVTGTTPGDYDVGSTDPTRLSFRFAAAATQPGLTYLLFAGTPAQILAEYTAQTGRPFIPPGWAFKHWRWRDEHTIGPAVEVDGEAINADVAEDLLMYEALGIPAGVYLIDRPWAGGAFGFDDFQWDPLRFPNPEGMMRVLQARGYRTAVWSAALASGTAPGSNGAEARAAGWLAPGLSRWPDTPEAQVIDLTNPDARAPGGSTSTSRSRAAGTSRRSSSTAARSTSAPSRPTSSPTVATASRCATSSRSSTCASTTTPCARRAATATSSSPRSPPTRARSPGGWCGAATRPVAPPSAPGPAPTSVCAAPSSCSSAPPSSASPSGGRTPAATTSSSSATSSPVGCSSAPSAR